MKSTCPALLALVLAASLSSCSSTARSIRAPEESPSVRTSAAPAVREMRRTPYGFTYRVGFGYAYRPWTW